MSRCGFCLGLVASITSIGAAARAAVVGAAPQPIYVSDPDSADDAGARAGFEAACRRHDLPAVIAITLSAPAAPRASEALREGLAHMDRLEFDGALRAFELAASHAALTGGAGLTTAELADIYLLRALALQKQGRGETTRSWDDFVRAATLAPDRVLDEGRFAPSVIETWKRALAGIQRGPRGTLVVRAPAGARIAVDARPALSAPAVLPGLPYGQHHVRVEEPGRVPWATAVPLAAALVELDVPARASLELDDAAAAGHGQRRGARFVLTARLRLRAEQPLYELELVAVAGAVRVDRRVALLDGEGALDAAIAALKQTATTRLAAALVAEAPRGGLPSASPQRVVARPERASRWATWTAVGLAVALAGAVAAGLLLRRDSSRGAGFSATADPSRLGR